jgi:hypothetical protein
MAGAFLVVRLHFPAYTTGKCSRVPFFASLPEGRPAMVSLVTEDEATAEAARRNAHDQEKGLWSVKQSASGDWNLVHVSAPGLKRIRPTGTHEESRPKPSEPPDPRPTITQNIPPYGAI